MKVKSVGAWFALLLLLCLCVSSWGACTQMKLTYQECGARHWADNTCSKAECDEETLCVRSGYYGEYIGTASKTCKSYSGYYTWFIEVNCVFAKHKPKRILLSVKMTQPCRVVRLQKIHSCLHVAKV